MLYISQEGSEAQVQIFNTPGQPLADDLRARLRKGSRLRIAAAAFSLYAFEALQEQLEQVEELEFLFTDPSFTAERATDRPHRERRQYLIPGFRPEESLYGTAFEVHLRNRMTQQAVARECADWIRRKVRFRANVSNQGMPTQFAMADGQTLYFPLQGFTTTDLGLATGDTVSNMVHRTEEPTITQHYLALFEQMWADPEKSQDVTEAVLRHIEDVYRENSPQRIYFMILQSVFAEFLDSLDETGLADERTGYQDSVVWQKLFDFQRDAARGIINKLDTYNGCILADSVGLGKTFTALAVIKYYELRNKNVLVLCPKKLAENWKTYNSNVRDNELAADRLRYDVLNHTDLSRTSGQSHGIDLSRLNWSNYDLVVIDESHNFRNADYAMDRESRYQRLLREVMREGVRTKVLMLSATPVNTRFNDLKSQLQLAYDDDSSAVEDRAGLSTTVSKVFSDAQKAFNEWSKLEPEDRTTRRLLETLDFDFFKLLDAVTIARSRRHIQDHYDSAALGAFPERMPVTSLQEPISHLPDGPGFQALAEIIGELNLGIYRPSSYILASRRDHYRDLYDRNPNSGPTEEELKWEEVLHDDDGAPMFGQTGREQGIHRLMTVNLLKRLESSVEAFRLTVQRLQESVNVALVRLDAHAAMAESRVGAELQAELEEAAEEDILQVGASVEIDLADMDVLRWRHDLEHDRGVLQKLLDAIAPVSPSQDAKLQRLITLIREKVRNPINEGNRKVLVFTAFADTANYLFENLRTALSEDGITSAVITGGSAKPRMSFEQRGSGSHADFNQVMTLFSPVSKKRDLLYPGDDREVDVLIGTDVISEGQNLQDCDFLVNFDIHWNPVRIIQRFGRVDRIGSTNSRIQMVNFWPDVELDSYIDLKSRVENRMVIADVSATSTDNLLRLEDANASYRREQLRRLKNEVLDLEETRSGISIMDLGLNDLRIELLNYVERHPDVGALPRGLHAVLPADPANGLPPGVVFALRNINADDTMHRGNRLHPHYLVYVDEAGEVVTDHTASKEMLDLLRLHARDRSEPVRAAVTAFNKATSEGADMGRYSELLTKAIRSMVTVTEERAVDSLFSSGATSPLEESLLGLDDFELTAFIAVVDTAGGVDG